MLFRSENREPDTRWAPRAQEARIIGYTETHGVYQAITSTGKRITTKDPKPIHEPEAANSQPETTNPEGQHEGANHQSEAAKTTIQEPRRSTRSGRDTRPFTQREMEGFRGIPHIVRRIGHDEDHPTEQQVAEMTSQIATEWAEAREKERQKLQKYGVYSIVPSIPPGHKAVDTKWVYDVVEAPRRLTLTFGGSTQERRGREHKVVERGGYGSMVWHNAVVKARKGCAHEGCGQKNSLIE